MNLQILSDLHTEWWTHPSAKKAPWLPETIGRESWLHSTTDVLILAGDITTANRVDSFLETLHHKTSEKPGLPILYVPGNHEYYGDIPANDVVPTLRSAVENNSYDLNIKLLDNDTFVHNGVCFIGSTLWSNLSNPLDVLIAEQRLADLKMPGLTPDWYLDKHKNSVTFIEKCLQDLTSFDKKVVITHHCPSLRSVDKKYRGDSLNPCFVTDLEYLMDSTNAPRVWIHGHTHTRFDYTVNNTRVVCNPLGYPGEKLRKDEYWGKLVTV